MNQPCQHCLRGLTVGKSEVCEPCSGTGVVQEKAAVTETVVQKVKRQVKKVLKNK